DWKIEIRTRLARLGIDPAREAGMVDEFAQHLEDRYEDLLSEGVGETEARRKALAELRDDDLKALGSPKPDPRARNSFPGSLFQDLRFAGRTLRKNPA